MYKYIHLIIFLYLFILFQTTNSKCTCEIQSKSENNQPEAFRYKLVAIAAILVASAVGVYIPLLLKSVSLFQPEKPLHFLIKALAAGVILATAFLHILPDAFESLTNPCLPRNPWGNFPFTGFIAMMAAIGTLSMESFATGYHVRAELRKPQPLDDELHEIRSVDSLENVGGHVNGPVDIMLERSNSTNLLRHRVISQVLELGILVHSIIIGVSLGATQSPKTIKPLIIALSFHQFFEGLGLGGCISQAKFKRKTVAVMVIFFSLTTPSGIGIGIAISNAYQKYSSTALVTEGVLNSASAGILIYMALVDLLAADFMNQKLQKNLKLQIGTNFALLLGSCCMAILARWGGT